MPSHRESAHALVQRLKATRVGLMPPIIHNATDGGLHQSDILLVGGAPGSGKTTWAYRVAARHLSCGGAVTFVFLPGSGNFLLRRFMEHLEDTAVPGAPLDVLGACASAIEARREVLLGVLARLEVVHCIDLTDFAVLCMHGPVCAGSPEVVPLVVVEGCGGKGTHIHHYERAIGNEVPLCHWLLGCLRRRRRCALILIEEWGAVTGNADHYRRSTREKSSIAATVEAESDFLRRLQNVTPRPTKSPRPFPRKRQRACSTAAAASIATDTSTNTSGTSINAALPSSREAESSLHYMGSLRLFYLHTEIVLAPAQGAVRVARLLKWQHLLDPLTSDGDDEGVDTSIKTPQHRRRRRWGQPQGRAPRWREEFLCTVQL
ncbi:hypothetical protein DQ04_03681030 [Trypanosoma grayi]|uniref:hypothetical protein n=1 Tax=Trypanosoma grayi TaxID=71804 RepID=UPI0004F45636|nr:hypothetical protein DQ04_03681030 [Trypanosoma grayi]KEG10468.1 hypothetical protein DQ04_03681030 [Trypanosoma grayi]